MGKKKIDVLLLARPDHSYTIYKGLLKSGLDFVYCSFKLMPQWMMRFVKNPRVRFYSDHYSNCKLLTLFHIYRVRYKKEFLEKYEKNLYEWHLRRLLKKVKPRIIHYWPYLSLDQIKEYKKHHPEVKTFADVYFPCELWVLDYIKPELAKYGLDNKMEIVERDMLKMKKVMEFEDNFMVPSQFIAETYKAYYPDKNYILMPYGLTKWNGYKKKNDVQSPSEIRKFVYAAGGLTIQKGCDYMMNYFQKHPELELHIYGNIPADQRHIFEKFLQCENIRFHGHIPKSQLQQEVSLYDVGIHLSRYDAYSIAVGEMMGAGLPVIVSNNTGIGTLVKSIDAGIVTPLSEELIETNIEEIRTPERYNHFINNLDKYLTVNQNGYEDEIVDFYRQQLQTK